MIQQCLEVLFEMSFTDIYHPVNINKTKSSLPVKKSIYKCRGVNFSLKCKYDPQGMCLICQTCFYGDLRLSGRPPFTKILTRQAIV